MSTTLRVRAHSVQRHLLLLVLLAVSTLLSACGTGGGGTAVSQPAQASVAVVLNFAPTVQAITPLVGAPALFSTTRSVRVQLLNPDDTSQVIAEAVAERGEAEDRLTVRFSDVRPGTYLVYVYCYTGSQQTGTCSGVALPSVTATQGEAVVEINEQASKRVVSLAISPKNEPSVDKDATLQMTAIATFSDESTQDVTLLSTWSVVGSEDVVPQSRASIDARTGLLTGQGGGLATVHAVFGDATAEQQVAIKELQYQLPYLDGTPSSINGSLAYFPYVRNQVYSLRFYNIYVNLPISYATSTSLLAPGQTVGTYDFYTKTPVSKGTIVILPDGTTSWSCAEGYASFETTVFFGPVGMTSDQVLAAYTASMQLRSNITVISPVDL